MGEKTAGIYSNGAVCAFRYFFLTSDTSDTEMPTPPSKLSVDDAICWLIARFGYVDDGNFGGIH